MKEANQLSESECVQCRLHRLHSSSYVNVSLCIVHVRARDICQPFSCIHTFGSCLCSVLSRHRGPIFRLINAEHVREGLLRISTRLQLPTNSVRNEPRVGSSVVSVKADSRLSTAPISRRTLMKSFLGCGDKQ